MIRSVFFDLDDTLISYEAAYDVALATSHALLREHYPQITRSDLSRAIMRAYEKRFGYGTPGFNDLGTLSVSELRYKLTELALEDLQVTTDPRLLTQFIAAHEAVEDAQIQPFADTVATLETLAKHCPLGVITNGPSAMQRAKMERLDLFRHFNHIVVDTEFGHSKPDTRIFRFAEKAIKLGPSELLFVGNSLEADIAGAVGAGWTSVWVNASGEPLPKGAPAPHYTVRSVGEILALPPVARLLSRH